MPYPYKSLGEYVHREPSYKLHRLQSDLLLHAAMPVIFVRERDSIVILLNETMVADSDFMSVSFQVLYYTLSVLKRSLHRQLGRGNH